MSDSSKALYGGGDRVNLKSVEALQAYHCYAIDYAKKSQYLDQIQPKVKDILRLKGYGKIHSGNRSSFSIGYTEILLYPFFLMINVVQALRFFKQHGLDKKHTLLYATTKKQLILAYLLRTFGYRYIFHAHSFDNKKSPFYRLIIQPQKKANRILCVSHFVQKNIALPHAQTLYNPITLPTKNKIYALPKKTQPKIIASFSTLIPLKGIIYFMKSHQCLKDKNTLYRIFGQGEQKKQLKKWENQQVKLHGFCKDVTQALQEIYVVVVPSISPESFGLVILEANALGIPVITTQLGAQAELVRSGYNGFVVAPKDERAIAEKINLLISDPSLYKKMSQNAKDYAQRFSFDNYKQKLVLAFEDTFQQIASPS